jgi:hypothetical protein
LAQVFMQVVAATVPALPPPAAAARQQRLPVVQLASVAHSWTVPPAHAAALATQVDWVTWVPPSRKRSVQHSIGGAHDVVPQATEAAPVAPPLLLELLPVPLGGQTAVLHG